MKFLVIEEIGDYCSVASTKPFATEEQAYKMCDLLRECSPDTRVYYVVELLEPKNLEVVGNE